MFQIKVILKLTLLIFLALAVGESTFGQIKTGVKAGMNLSKGVFNEDHTDNIIRFNTGLLAIVDLNEQFFLRPELIYSMKGWHFTGGSMNLHYLNVPVLFGYKPIPDLAVLAGPELGFLVSAARRPQSPDTNFNKVYEKFDLGISVGSSYTFTENFGIEIRYIYGFDTLIKFSNRDVNGSPTGTIRDGGNRVWQLGLFYLLRKKKNG